MSLDGGPPSSFSRHTHLIPGVERGGWLVIVLHCQLRPQLDNAPASASRAQRGITVSYEAIRYWCRTFGPEYARTRRRRRGRMGDTWYLDELLVMIRGRQQYLWRAVDQDGDVIDILVHWTVAARILRRPNGPPLSLCPDPSR